MISTSHNTHVDLQHDGSRLPRTPLCVDSWLRRDQPPVLTIFLRGADEKSCAGSDLLYRRHVHLAGAETGWGLLVRDVLPMLLARRTEVDRLRVFVPDVTDDVAILAEEQATRWVHHDSLGLERTARQSMIAVGDHLDVVHVDVVLSVQEWACPHADEETLAYACLVVQALRRSFGALATAFPM